MHQRPGVGLARSRRFMCGGWVESRIIYSMENVRTTHAIESRGYEDRVMTCPSEGQDRPIIRQCYRSVPSGQTTLGRAAGIQRMVEEHELDRKTR